jgi:5-formyltetrahydrofolate cyclo-ligase
VNARDLRARKRALRRHVRELREGLPEDERVERSRAVAGNVLRLPVLEDATTVMAFSPFGSEVDIRPLLEVLLERTAQLALPRVEGRSIVAVAYRPGDPMRRASFGALEPAGDDVVAPQEIDVVLTPGLAFDRRGYRLGYGRGYYDRFLRRLRADAVAVGVAFAAQIVDEVPHGRGDRAVDLVVTEDGVIPTT